MATLKGGEVIVAAVRAKLEGGMPGRVAAVNAEKADAITVATPVDYYEGGASGMPRAPSVIVSEGPTEYGEEGSHALVGDTQILVRVYDQDQSRGNLVKRLQRLARCAIETVWDDDPKEQLTGSAYSIQPARTRPGPVSEPDEEGDFWRSYFDIVFIATQFES